VLSASAPPRPTTALVGRVEEIAAVVDLVADSRLVTLTGPPGVGKTRLAAAVADLVVDRFAEGVAWVDLVPVRGAQQLHAEVARALEGRTDALPDRAALLVLDNCEQLLDAVAELTRRITAGSRLCVLATSRERLHLTAEREFAVPPLPMPDDAALGDLVALRRNPAMALLLARAPGGVSLTERSAQPLADICLRLDGMPLALELAAARLRVFTPAELSFRLEHRAAALAGGPRDAPARHRDLRAAIGWSHDLLADRDRIVFRRLAVFPGEWEVAAADAVCAVPEVLDSVESLLEKSLVQRAASDGVTTRFRMLTSIREFAAEQLIAHDEDDAIRDRHVAYVAELARGWEHTVGTDRENVTWSALGGLRADLAVTFERARATADTTRLSWLAAAIGWYAYTRGRLGMGREVIAAIALVDRIDDADARGAATLAAGIVAYGMSDLETAGRHLQHARELAAAGGTERRTAIAEAFLGHVARDQGDLDSAAGRYSAAREIYARLGSRRGTAWADHDLALLAIARQRWSDADALLRAAITTFEGLGYDWAIAACAQALALALLSRDDTAEAGAMLDRALALHAQVGDRRGIAQCLEGLAQLALASGRASWAARLFGAAQAERTGAGAALTEAEAARAARLDREVTRVLGRSAADHEQHAGRTMPAAAVRELAARVTAQPEFDAPNLTPRQWEVAERIAAGDTNRQISTRLGISEKTAEIHVHNIMQRLATPSRAGVAAWMARRTR
jgi:non-specific serine/threonine protein kinase